eukprot:TRINITY_DN1064_c0_g1_i1.p1 TRINITY_DN1064_c0_g1~~TRINITY_DN1064_c0_g1_i1.p1  ORF type:complete len:294 (-),score=55.98 TRINITY_DN1064_c0_g1_i1:130-1011(-)
MIAGCKFFNWDSMTTNSSRPLRSKDLRMSVDFLTSHDVQKFGEPVFPVPVMYMTATSFSSFPKYPFLKHNVDMGSPRRSSPHTSMPSMGGTTTTTFSDESPTMGIVKEISDTAIKMALEDSVDSGDEVGSSSEHATHVPFIFTECNPEKQHEYSSQSELTRKFRLPRGFRFRDARKKLFRRCSREHLSFILSHSLNRYLSNRLPHRLTSEHYARAVISMAFHMTVHYGRIPPFWEQADKELIGVLAGPDCFDRLNPLIGLRLHARRERLSIEGLRSEPYEVSYRHVSGINPRW